MLVPSILATALPDASILLWNVTIAMIVQSILASRVLDATSPALVVTIMMHAPPIPAILALAVRMKLYHVMTATPVPMILAIPPLGVNTLKSTVTMMMNVPPTHVVQLQADVSTLLYLATILMPAQQRLVILQPDAYPHP
jgi:hypothetical protein